MLISRRLANRAQNRLQEILSTTEVSLLEIKQLIAAGHWARALSAIEHFQGQHVTEIHKMADLLNSHVETSAQARTRGEHEIDG